MYNSINNGAILVGKTVTSEFAVDSKNILIEVDQKWSKYVLEKGYISINGCSLTVGEVSRNSFKLHLIPETLRATNLDKLVFGKFVNTELDQSTIAIVDTTERLAHRN